MTKPIVYSTPHCAWCNKLKTYLDAEKIDYITKDVNTDMQNREEMATKSGQYGVPVIDVGGRIIVGFDQDAIENAIRGANKDGNRSNKKTRG